MFEYIVISIFVAIIFFILTTFSLFISGRIFGIRKLSYKKSIEIILQTNLLLIILGFFIYSLESDVLKGFISFVFFIIFNFILIKFYCGCSFLDSFKITLVHSVFTFFIFLVFAGLSFLFGSFSNTLDLDRSSNNSRNYDPRMKLHSSLEEPFSISVINLSSERINFKLRNQGSQNLVIDKIEITNCKEISPEALLQADTSKSFTVYCDINTGYFKEYIDIQYHKKGDSQELLAQGSLATY